METIVFWDVEGCSLPVGLNGDDMWLIIRNTLRNLGYYNVSIHAYINFYAIDFASAYIPVHHGVSEDERRKVILADLFSDVACNGPLNLMIIMSDISQHSRFIDGIRYLQLKRGCNFLLAQLNMPSEEVLKIVSKVWLWDSLSTGGNPLGHNGSDEDTDSED